MSKSDSLRLVTSLIISDNLIRDSYLSMLCYLQYCLSLVLGLSQGMLRFIQNPRIKHRHTNLNEYSINTLIRSVTVKKKQVSIFLENILHEQDKRTWQFCTSGYYFSLGMLSGLGGSGSLPRLV